MPKREIHLFSSRETHRNWCSCILWVKTRRTATVGIGRHVSPLSHGDLPSGIMFGDAGQRWWMNGGIICCGPQWSISTKACIYQASKYHSNELCSRSYVQGKGKTTLWNIHVLWLVPGRKHIHKELAWDRLPLYVSLSCLPAKSSKLGIKQHEKLQETGYLINTFQIKESKGFELCKHLKRRFTLIWLFSAARLLLGKSSSWLLVVTKEG